ncbi:hypothetical protein KIN20_021536 [Parelaphostrongylus tenuis]|uniref:Uncharacterized protein n=1 Tax=Parelaphostrongylus tenuis TaxID=148309 RepID=A0AAD5QW95_PARTN|nr:hypothetical protein KIN20_021536 [Parelaphostrongylus tenuis]
MYRSKQVFKGYRMYLILLVPFFYSLVFTFFTPPMLFDSTHMAWLFPSFASETSTLKQYSHALTANNVFIVVTTCLLYMKYARVILRSSESRMTWGEKIVFHSNVIHLHGKFCGGDDLHLHAIRVHPDFFSRDSSHRLATRSWIPSVCVPRCQQDHTT